MSSFDTHAAVNALRGVGIKEHQTEASVNMDRARTKALRLGACSRMARCWLRKRVVGAGWLAGLVRRYVNGVKIYN